MSLYEAVVLFLVVAVVVFGVTGIAGGRRR